MPGTNQFLAFATGGGADTLSPAAYAALTTLLANGYQSGTANAQQMNTTWRQATTMAAVIGKVIADGGNDALDNGNVATLAANLLASLGVLLTRRAAPGVVEAYAGSTPPAGSFECDGQSLDRTTYAALFAVIGVDFGAVDSTHFNVPDLRGYFLRGWDHGAGRDPSRTRNSYQTDSTAAPKNTTVQKYYDGGIASLTAPATNPSKVGFARASKTGETTTAGSLDSAGSANGETDVLNVVTGDRETRPINLAMMYIIWA